MSVRKKHFEPCQNLFLDKTTPINVLTVQQTAAPGQATFPVPHKFRSGVSGFKDSTWALFCGVSGEEELLSGMHIFRKNASHSRSRSSHGLAVALPPPSRLVLGELNRATKIVQIIYLRQISPLCLVFFFAKRDSFLAIIFRQITTTTKSESI